MSSLSRTPERLDDVPVESGDVVCGLFGIQMPFVLRRAAASYTMVGIAHIGGHTYEHATVESSSGALYSAGTDFKNTRRYDII